MVKVFFCLMVVICSINAIEIDLSQHEKHVYSQTGEDGVIEEIFRAIGVTNKFFVEFGAGNGRDFSNTLLLKEQHGWSGLMMDGDPAYENHSISLYCEFITAENIISLLDKYNVPEQFDLISIDIDRNDFYVWRALTTKYKPRVVVIEFNCNFSPDQDKVVKYDSQGVWDCTDYYGASILAFYKLGKSMGYSLVYQESKAVNLFFVRDDILEVSDVRFKNQNDVEKLFNCPIWRLDRNKGKLNNPYLYPYEDREFVSSDL